MDLIEYISRVPEEDVALDELLLEEAETGASGESLRFWEAKDYFVVVGRASRVGEDCMLGACNSDNIKVVRRVSGGGTVLQGPGCLNYSLVLSYKNDTGYANINTSYQSILEGIAASLRRRGHDAAFLPISDLAIREKKISGNAQARKRKFFLHHGTLLYNSDIEKIGRYLGHPSREPSYRKGRSHADFLANIPAKKEELIKAVKETFGANRESRTLSANEIESLRELVNGKYSKDSWNYCF